MGEGLTGSVGTAVNVENHKKPLTTIFNYTSRQLWESNA